MRKILSVNKKSQSEILTTIISLIIISSSILLGSNLTMNGSVIAGNGNSINVIEKSSGIEIWADTVIELNFNNYSLEALLTLDNETSLPEMVVEFYIDSSLMESSLTNTNGHAQPNLTLYNNSPGTYSLRVEFQGSNSSYLNPSSEEKLIEITENNGTKEIKVVELNETEITLPILNETNFTILNETNLTILTNVTNITIITLDGCKSFWEQVLWSSGYTHNKEGSTNYQIWYPQYNCSEIGGDNCFLGDVKLESRLISVDYPENGTEGYGYIQISNPNECDNIEDAEYSNYLAYDKILGEEIRKGEYCKNGKDGECDEENYFIEDYSSCYGIKSYGSQYLIIDAFSVNYTLCEYGSIIVKSVESGGENES